MRFMMAVLILTVSAPAFAADRKGQCKTRCDGNFQYCMKRATNKQAKKICKTDRKNCKGQCR
jgi:hypothetical protein